MKSLTLELNAKLQPADRAHYFENPIDEELKKMNAGEVTGGGTFLLASKEFSKCDITFSIEDEWLECFSKGLQNFYFVPKGSKVIINDEETDIGQAEGMAIYLNGTDLPEEVYKSNDVNELVSDLQDVLKDKYLIFSYWEGEKETGLYFYGPSFTDMKDAAKQLVDTHPLCRLSRIEQIA